MTTLDLQIIHNNDDATGTLSGSQFNAAQSAVRMDSSTSGDGSRWLSGFRFQNVTIPQGATIDVAYVTFNLITGSDDANVDMYAEDTDDAVDFAAANLISRTLTTATAGWVQANASSPAQSPSIVSLIQEVIDRPGWTSGNDLCLIFIGRADFTGQFRVVAHDGTPANAAALHIEYTEAGGSPVTINAAVGTLALSGPQAAIEPGAVSIAANVGALVLSGPQATVQPGAVAIPVAVGTLILTGPQAAIIAAALIAGSVVVLDDYALYTVGIEDSPAYHVEIQEEALYNVAIEDDAL